MKIYTAKYKAEQPANKELHVPADSRYGVGLQFEKDGQPWDLLPDEVTLDGLSADDVVDGTFIFERTSGEHGQKVSDVRAVDMGVHEIADNIKSQTNSTARQLNVADFYNVQLSSVISEPVEVAYDQFTVATRTGQTEEAMLSADFTVWNEDYTGSSLTRFIYEQSGLPAGTYYILWQPTRQFARYENFAQVYMTDSITLYPSGYVRAAQVIPARKTLYGETKLTIDTADTIRNYKLTETTEDQGIVLGFNEKYVLKDTIELSGSYDDDTTFSYTLPTTN